MCYTTDNDPLNAEVRRMRTPKISLRTGLSMAIVLCWLAPILLLVVTFAAMLEQSYKRSARQETDDTAQFALMQIQTELENAINDSKSVSYDGVIRSAYLNYREDGNKITLYRSVNGYLRDSFSAPTSTGRCSLSFGMSRSTGSTPSAPGRAVRR